MELGYLVDDTVEPVQFRWSVLSFLMVRLYAVHRYQVTQEIYLKFGQEPITRSLPLLNRFLERHLPLLVLFL